MLCAHPCLSISAIIPTYFSFISLLLAPQTINWIGQELCFIYMCSTYLNYCKTDDCSPSIFQHLWGDTKQKIWILFLVYYSSSQNLTAPLAVSVYFQAQDPVAQNTTRSPSKEPIHRCEHQAVLLQNCSMGQKSVFSFNIHAIPKRMEPELLNTNTIQTTTLIFYNLPFLLARAAWPTKGYAYKIVRLQLLSC